MIQQANLSRVFDDKKTAVSVDPAIQIRYALSCGLCLLELNVIVFSAQPELIKYIVYNFQDSSCIRNSSQGVNVYVSSTTSQRCARILVIFDDFIREHRKHAGL